MLDAEAARRAQEGAERTALQSSLAEHLQAVNATLDPHEQFQCIVIVTAAWTVDNDIITPTFKVKHNCFEEVYAAN
jgi:long-chain acyl-CoA synthetase